uniref:RING-type domain-containing protein n=1 Tax=Denticeps clupeoides TaxID=299321 RepID=A0AAY4A5U0_9TELE
MYLHMEIFLRNESESWSVRKNSPRRKIQKLSESNDLKFVTRRDDISKMSNMLYTTAKDYKPFITFSAKLTSKTNLRFQCSSFGCPLTDGTVKKCRASWSYEEVRRVALLTDEEQNDFEEKIARMAALENCEYKSCPGCQTCVERKNLTNLCVHCTVCTDLNGRTFYFCWQCLQKWNGPYSRRDRCDNEGCVNPDVAKLQKCKDTTLVHAQNVAFPSLHACPKCGRWSSASSAYNTPRTGGVAPRQASIPVWQK